MTIEGNELVVKIINKQFSMIGEKMTFQELPEDGIIEVGGKKKEWYNHYKWESIEQYQEWRKWAGEKLKSLGESAATYLLNYADFRYGFIIRIKKEGTLF